MAYHPEGSRRHRETIREEITIHRGKLPFESSSVKRQLGKVGKVAVEELAWGGKAKGRAKW